MRPALFRFDASGIGSYPAFGFRSGVTGLPGAPPAGETPSAMSHMRTAALPCTDSAPGAAHAVSAQDFSPRGHALSRRRGSAPVLARVPAPPEPVRVKKGTVTLWDEIAPPLPLPVPLDAAAALDGIASWKNK